MKHAICAVVSFIVFFSYSMEKNTEFTNTNKTNKKPSLSPSTSPSASPETMIRVSANRKINQKTSIDKHELIKPWSSMQSTRRSEDTQEKSGIIRTHSDPTIKSTQTNADIKQSKSEGNLSNKGPINKHIARTQSQILANNQIFINQENMNSYVDEMKKKGT